VAGRAADPSAGTVLFWQDSCLVRGREPAQVHPSEVHDPVLLGLAGGSGVFAADLSAMTEPEALRVAGASATVDIRQLFASLAADQAALLAFARGLLHWNRNQRFCGACGSATLRRDAGHLRACSGCGKLLFPRIEPAVIVLIEAPGPPSRCLLARHRGAAAGAYSTLAGFVEIGESLEGAVRRETLEEAGVPVAQVRYQASQAWPFPAGLMVGFRAVAESELIAVDGAELVEARWFTREEVLALGEGRVDSIEHFLVSSWLRDTA
jgi:NAD+ diphosphatase